MNLSRTLKRKTIPLRRSSRNDGDDMNYYVGISSRTAVRSPTFIVVQSFQAMMEREKSSNIVLR